MKKLLLVLGLLLFTGCTSTIEQQYTDITYEKFKTMIDSDTTFVLFVYQTGCSHCELMEPKLNEIIKDNQLVIYAINLANLTEEDNDLLYKKTFVSGTPTIIYYKDGALQANKLIGDAKKDVIITYLTEVGSIS